MGDLNENARLVSISDKEYDKLRQFVYDTIGINLTDQKRNLLSGRLQKILRARKIPTFEDYYEILKTDSKGELLSELANNISTNHTYFWREQDHFVFFLEKVLPLIDKKLAKTGTKDIRVWSAGCSSGEEPYTLVMLMMEYFGERYHKLDAGVLATDISEKALNIARTGIYSKERIKSMPEKYKKKYFKRLDEDNWEIIDELKREVTYRRFNFMNKHFPFKKTFDAIFCRNVMIYFDEETRNELTKKFYHLTSPGGFFFIGHSETLNRLKNQDYKYVKPALYQKI